MYLIVYVRYLSEHPQRTKQNPGRHDQRSLGQLRIPNTQDEFGLDNVRFNQAMQNTAGRVDHREKYGEYWRSNCYLGGCYPKQGWKFKNNEKQIWICFFIVPQSGSSRGISFAGYFGLCFAHVQFSIYALSI